MPKIAAVKYRMLPRPTAPMASGATRPTISVSTTPMSIHPSSATMTGQARRSVGSRSRRTASISARAGAGIRERIYHGGYRSRSGSALAIADCRLQITKVTRILRLADWDCGFRAAGRGYARGFSISSRGAGRACPSWACASGRDVAAASARRDQRPVSLRDSPVAATTVAQGVSQRGVRAEGARTARQVPAAFGADREWILTGQPNLTGGQEITAGGYEHQESRSTLTLSPRLLSRGFPVPGCVLLTPGLLFSRMTLRAAPPPGVVPRRRARRPWAVARR